jgi:hypothetical protein
VLEKPPSLEDVLSSAFDEDEFDFSLDGVTTTTNAHVSTPDAVPGWSAVQTTVRSPETPASVTSMSGAGSPIDRAGSATSIEGMYGEFGGGGGSGGYGETQSTRADVSSVDRAVLRHPATEPQKIPLQRANSVLYGEQSGGYSPGYGEAAGGYSPQSQASPVVLTQAPPVASVHAESWGEPPRAQVRAAPAVPPPSSQSWGEPQQPTSQYNSAAGAVWGAAVQPSTVGGGGGWSAPPPQQQPQQQWGAPPPQQQPQLGATNPFAPTNPFGGMAASQQPAQQAPTAAPMRPRFDPKTGKPLF